jgi:hypothetical protein
MKIIFTAETAENAEINSKPIFFLRGLCGLRGEIIYPIARSAIWHTIFA